MDGAPPSEEVERALLAEFDTMKLRIKCAGVLARIVTLVDVIEVGRWVGGWVVAIGMSFVCAHSVDSPTHPPTHPPTSFSIQSEPVTPGQQKCLKMIREAARSEVLQQ